MRVAVLDLGTNVFNLLLSDFSKEKGCRTIREFKCASRLGAGGLRKGAIAPAAYRTAEAALQQIMEVIRECGGADEIIPYATSAVRDASNGLDFAQCMDRRFGFRIRVIPGEREAELIFKGIMESMADLKDAQGRFSSGENALLLDIGGGSDEFIITDGKDILWKRSFPIGMARMRETFTYEDPIGQNVMEEFRKFTSAQLEELWEKVGLYKPSIFIGSSGSFDTFKDLLFNCRFRERPSMELPAEDLARLDARLVRSTRQERMQMPGMSPIRVDYIVLASVFAQMVIARVKPRVIYQSSFSLKEGGMKEEFDKFMER